MATIPLNPRELVQMLLMDGRPQATELMDALDLAEEMDAVVYEFDLAPGVSLEDEARRLVTFEADVRRLLVDWGAVDPDDDNPPDPLDILRMLLG